MSTHPQRAGPYWASLGDVLAVADPDVATVLNNLAELYQDQGRYADAEPLLKRALKIIEKSSGPNDSNFMTGLNNLALIYALQGRYADVEPLFKRSLAIREKVLGPDHRDVGSRCMVWRVFTKNRVVMPMPSRFTSGR
jgi:tetratricopeptide (TPR) repeat protein